MLLQILLILRLSTKHWDFTSRSSHKNLLVNLYMPSARNQHFPQLPKLTRDTIYADVNPPGILAADFPVEMYAPNHERNNEDSEKACLRNGNICINMPRGIALHTRKDLGLIPKTYVHQYIQNIQACCLPLTSTSTFPHLNL